MRYALAAGILAVGTLAVNSAGHAQIDFVGSEQCSACHGDQHQAWIDSHHGWALREAQPQNVLADFDNVSFDIGGTSARFFRRDGKYYVELAEDGGPPTEYEIRYAVGVEPLQQYLVETENGRLQTLDVAWDTSEQRWFHLYPDAIPDAGDGLHWTGPYKNWQARCATCHQTNFEKNFDRTTDGYQSTWSELTIGCEACHGAGGAHVAWARDPDGYDPDQFSDADTRGLLVEFLDGTGGQRIEVEVCAACHSRREAFDPHSRIPGTAFNDNFSLAVLRPGTYHPDGQIDDEVYVYGSFLQSKMYANGVKCSNCHDVHSGDLIAEGNAVCTQCHNEDGREEFPTLPLANYDSPEHHHHQTGGQGAECVSCHMPAKNYMVVDPRRDHSFRIPRPDLSVKIGTPNACNGCHEDESAEWAAARIVEWFPASAGKPRHFGEVFHAAGLFSDRETTERLINIARNQETAGIVRASAVSLLAQRMNESAAQSLLPLLSDDDPMVRAAVARAFLSAPSSLRARFIAGLMTDESRLVRHAAARATLDLPTDGLSEEELKVVSDARDDFRRSMAGQLDFPEAHMQLGGIALLRRNLPAAKSAFETAVRLDPQLVDAWLTLGRVAFVEAGAESAATILQSAIAANPEVAILRQSLGNAYLEQGRLDASLEALEEARGFEPDEPSIPLDIAQVHLAAEEPELATAELEDARARGLLIPEILDLLTMIYLQDGDSDRASDVARDLKSRYPNYQASPEVQAVLESLE